MNILVTGANGFIGRALTARLCAGGGPAFERLTLLDQHFDAPPPSPAVTLVAGSFADPAIVARAVQDGIDLVFHLAGVTSRQAEVEFEAGRACNIDGTFALIDALRAQGNCPVLVFASSIAVFGRPLPDHVDDETLPLPSLSYGAQKLIAETMLADYSRRGWIDARAMRLPGILARPRRPNGPLSAFWSDLIHALRAGEPFICPVSAQATVWLMSVGRCVDNLLHAGALPAMRLTQRRAWNLPALRLSVAELAEAVSATFGVDVRRLLSYAPDEQLEAQFGRLPPLAAPLAESLGFRHDGTARVFVERAVATTA